MSNIFGANDGVVSIGTVAAVPTGPRGIGIKSISYFSGTLRMTMTDDRVVTVPMPIGGGIGDGSTGDPATSIPLTQEVIDYVNSQLMPYTVADANLDGRMDTAEGNILAMQAVDTSLTQRVTAAEGVNSAQGTRLDTLDKSVADVVAAGATDAELAKAIADLNMAAYLLASDAANLYASKTHNHAIADVGNLQATLDDMNVRIDAATGVDMSQYVTNNSLATALVPYMKTADADGKFALKAHNHAMADVSGLQAALDTKFTAPTSGTTGNVLTWDGTKLALAAPTGNTTDMSAYLKTADADNKYALKAHTHVIADVTGLQAALDAKQVKLTDGTATGQVLTWDGTRYAPATASASTVTMERFAMTGTLAVKTGAMRAYNTTSTTRTITGLHAAVGTAPTGSAVTAAIKVNGTQLGTVSIAAGALTGTATLSASWPVDGYLTCDVTAVGSTTAGADLVVTVKAS